MAAFNGPVDVEDPWMNVNCGSGYRLIYTPTRSTSWSFQESKFRVEEPNSEGHQLEGKMYVST